MQRRTFLGALAAIPLLSACGASTGNTAAETNPKNDAGRLAVGMIPVAHFAPVYIAQQEGFFKNEGLEVSTQVIQSSSAIVPSVINGQLQIGTSAGTAFINPVAKNLPIRAVAPAGANPASPEEDTIAILVAPDGPRSVRELEGVPMAVNAIGSQPHIAAAKLLLDAGGNPKKMQPISMPMPDSLAALQQGRVKAAAMAEPFVSLGRQQGARVLTALYSVAFQNTGAESVYFASQAYIDSRRDEVDAFNRALIRANQAANEDHALLVDVLVSKLNMKEGVAKMMVPPTFATSLTPTTLEEISHVMVETGFLTEPVPADKLVIS